MLPPAPPQALVRVGLSVFKWLPQPLRLRLVRLGTPNYTAGALVLVRRERDLLLVCQRHTDQWALPGGLLSRGETPEVAARRELAEELGDAASCWDIRLPVGVLVDPAPQRVDVLFAIDVPPGTPAPSGRGAEVLETRWFPPDRLPTLTPVTPAILQAYARFGALPGAVV